MDLVKVGLSLRNVCSEITCPDYYFCLHHDHQCHPCKSFCDENTDNFDAHICESQCQDYIHDFIKRYLRLSTIKNYVNNFVSDYTKRFRKEAGDSHRDALQELESVKSQLNMLNSMGIPLLVILVILLCTIGLFLLVQYLRRNEEWNNSGNPDVMLQPISINSNSANVVDDTAETAVAIMDVQTVTIDVPTAKASTSFGSTAVEVMIEATERGLTNESFCDDETLVEK